MHWGQLLDPERVSRIFGTVARRAGIPSEVQPLHGQRHFHITAMHRAGVDLATAKERAGHADLRSTLGYVTPDRDRDREAAAKTLDGLL